MQKLFNELLSLVDRSNRKKIVIDLVGVEYMHSSAFVKLVELNRNVGFQGGALCLCNLEPEVHELFTLAGLTKMIDVYDGQWAAVKSLSGEQS